MKIRTSEISFTWSIIEKDYLQFTEQQRVRKDGAEIPRGWSMSECIKSSMVFNTHI